MNPALHRVHFFFIKLKFDDCREVCHLLQRSWAFTAEKLGKFTCEVCRKDCRAWNGTHCNLLLHTDGTNAIAAVAVVVAREDIPGIEAQVVSAVVVARIERTRPIVAVSTCIVEARIVAITGSRQEDTIAVALTGYLPAFNAIRGCPCSGRATAVDEFKELLKARYLPVATPIHCSSIVRRFKFCLVIDDTFIVTRAIFCYYFFWTFKILVCTPTVITLWCCFAPSKVITIFFRAVGTNITRCPQSSTWQTEVNIIMVFL